MHEVFCVTTAEGRLPTGSLVHMCSRSFWFVFQPAQRGTVSTRGTAHSSSGAPSRKLACVMFAMYTRFSPISLGPMTRILQLNCQGGLRFKVHEIVEWCQEEKCELAAISESWLCSERCVLDHRCASMPNIGSWRWIGRARDTKGGGVGFLVSSRLTAMHMPELRTEGLENEWLELLSGSNNEKYLE